MQIQNLPIKEKSNVYFKLVWLVMALSSIVIIEPAPTDLLIAALFVLGTFTFQLSFKSTYIAKPMLFIFIFTVGTLISMYEIEFVSMGIRFIFITFYMVLSWFFFLTFIIKHKERAVNLLFSGYIFTAIASSLIGLFSYFHFIPFQNILLYHEIRIKSLFKDPNVFGPFMIPIAIYAISRFEKTKGKARFGWLLVLLITSLSVLLSFSRGAWFNYALAVGVYFGLKILLKPSLKTIFRYFLILLTLFIVVNWILSIGNIGSVFDARSKYQYYDDGRFANQFVAFKTALSNPLGLGPAQYDQIVKYQTHNNYLMVWAENGWISAVAFVGFLALTMHRSLKLAIHSGNTVHLVVFSCLCGLALNSLVVDTLHWRHYWFLLAIPWAFKVEKTTTKLFFRVRLR